jgi:heme oxygenase
VSVTADPTDTDPTTEPLSVRVREGSRAAHERAETSAFATALVDGRLDRSAYADMLGQLWFVYGALESVAEAQRADPVGQAFVLDELTRGPALRADLDYWAGPGWEGQLRPLPATQAYVDRLEQVARPWAGGFVAHQYTRYLGDLSGGQAIRVALSRQHDLTGDEGVALYRFPGIPKVKPFKDRYRALLDAAAWDEAERSRIVQEVQVAFACNSALFADLAHHVTT